MNQRINIASDDINTFNAIATHLRVPELSYSMAESEELKMEIQSFFKQLSYDTANDRIESASKHLNFALNKTTLPVSLNNFAFLTDRIFDVWGRKNNLSDEIQLILGSWRHPFLKIIYKNININLITLFAKLINAITNDTLGWEPRPERSKKILLDELNEISTLLFQLSFETEQGLQLLFKRWQDFSQKQSVKTHKVIERLKTSEAQKSWTDYCDLYAKSYLNALFSGQSISATLQNFISTCWLNLLTKSIIKTTNPELSTEMQTLTAKIKAVFGTKGKAALKWADNLLDDMQLECTKHNIVIEESIWQNVEKDLVTILQNETLEECLFVSFDGVQEWSKPAEVLLNSKVEEGGWLFTQKESQVFREQVIAKFPETQEVLLSNHLGMKSQRCRYSDINFEFSNQTRKPLLPSANFLEIVQKTNAGLLKVALTQQKARAIAADKARKEAQVLQQEKEHAEKMARIKAQEIAEKTKQLQKKREEKLKAEFASVKKTFIPMHNVFRIDQVPAEGTAKIHPKHPAGSNVRSFPDHRDDRNS